MKTIFTLIRREWEENYKSIIGFFIIANAFFIAIITYSVYNALQITLREQQFFFSMDSIYGFYVLLFFSGAIFSAYLAFSSFNKKSSICPYLLLPASVKQKWLSKWGFYTFIYFIIQPLVLALIYYAARDIVYDMEFVQHFAPKRFSMPGLFDYEMVTFFVIYFFLQSFLFIGMIHFKKYAFVKSFILFIIFAFFLIYFLREVGYQIINEEGFFFSRSSMYLNFSTGNLYRINYTTPPTIIACLILFWITICILLLSASFYKLKEREL